MYFLRFFLGGVFLFCSFIISAEQALMPYVGLDMQQRNMSFKKNYGGNIYSEKSLQNNLYLGFRLNNYFGLEGGYQSSQNTSKQSTVVVGEYVFGQVVDGLNLGVDGFIVTKTSIRTKGPHLNIIGFLPVADGGTQFITSLGITSLTLKAEYKQLADNFLGAYQPQYVTETTRDFLSTLVIPRYMLGVQRKFTESLGFRASFLYEFTSRFKKMVAKNPLSQSDDLLPGDGALRASLRNSITYGLGVFMNF